MKTIASFTFLVVMLHSLRDGVNSFARLSNLRGKNLPCLTQSLSIKTATNLGSSVQSPEAESITSTIKVQGDIIRDLKAAKADKDQIGNAVTKLLQLKEEYQKITGVSYDPPKVDKSLKSSKSSKSDDKGIATESAIITPRAMDYSAWYRDVITASDMVDDSPVRGCMVIKPWGMGTWDLLRRELDDRITESGTQNAYFPLFIPMSFLAKEAEHVEGFAKECAVVTHHRLCATPDGKDLMPDPEAKLDEPLVVRPTSETVIWNMFGKWIKSHRDLPLKINQWANVVRWEMRTRPFLRSSEFLWQEGHTAHSSKQEAVDCALESLDMYASVCEDMLALPTIKGVKSPSERFAGADDTYTIEALMQNGWALQSGTSHFLGQNFAKAFDVFFQTENEERELVWATSWGVSTRLLGAMVMTHSDDKGLVLPPPVAPLQVVIVPISKGVGKENEDGVMDRVSHLEKLLKQHKIRVKVDARSNMRPGAKYFEWERKGLPVRLEVGARDVASQSAVMAVRHTGDKVTVSTADDDEFISAIQTTLTKMHQDLFKSATDRLHAKTFKLDTYAELKTMMTAPAGDGTGGISENAGFYLVPWKCNAENEDKIKEECRATIRCYPFHLNSPSSATFIDATKLKCFYSGDAATHMAIFARAF